MIDYKFSKIVRATIKEQPLSKASTISHSFRKLFSAPSEYEYPEIISCENLSCEKLSALNSYFDHVYVVNLIRRSDRRLEMIQKLESLKIQAEFFTAEDGLSTKNIEEFRKYLDTPIDPDTAHELELKLKRKVIYSQGAWATLKTYRRLLEDARARGFRKILCLQDDAIFKTNFEKWFREMVSIVPASWKLLYLGASQHSWKEGEDLHFITGKEIKRTHLCCYQPVTTDGAFAIGIDHGAFDFLLAEIEKMNCSFDSGALRQASKYFKGHCWVVNPNLIIADLRDSDIRLARKQNDFARTFRWDLEKYNFPFPKALVSVIVPAYNAAGTIQKSILSLQTQSYKELEIIVVDDCSADDTAAIVTRIAKNDRRVQLIRHKANKGAYGARNTGIRASRGKYLAFQDADDFSMPKRIEYQLIPLCLGKAQFTMSRIVRSKMAPEMFDNRAPEKMAELLIDDYEQSNTHSRNSPEFQKIGYISTIIDRRLFEELGLFWINRFGSDAEFIERVLFRKAGVLLPPGVYMQRYLAQIESIDKLFKRIDKVLMICLVTGEQNLSVKHTNEERLQFQELFRKRLQGEHDYDYPSLKCSADEPDGPQYPGSPPKKGDEKRPYHEKSGHRPSL